ncbi:dihydrodipicolinate reductase, family protein [Mycobacterium xenopi 3993]|nr:dihydrodipicolinate reductase, family protein [Mycobacterium xenopi 3993]
MWKVGVWGPGSMGLIALRAVIDHPQLELVDLVVHSDAKAGVDAGQLCGIDPVGVVATQDPGPMLAGLPMPWSTRPRPTCGRWRRSRIWRRSCGPAKTWCRARWCRLCFPTPSIRRSPTRCERPRWLAGRRSLPQESIPDLPMIYYHWHFQGSHG